MLLVEIYINKHMLIIYLITGMLVKFNNELSEERNNIFVVFSDFVI